MCVIYQNICFWQNGLHVANVMEFIAIESGVRQERFTLLCRLQPQGTYNLMECSLLLR